MALIDERGRVFGKINLIDALVTIFVIALVPVGYATALLFRESAPTITSISPSRVVTNVPTTVRFTGQDFQPFLTATVGAFQAPFLVESATTGQIALPTGLQPGTYDVALYDQARELVRVPGALTVVGLASGPASIELQAVGGFVGAAATAAAAGLRVGSTFRLLGDRPGSVAEVLAIGAPRPLTKRVRVSDVAFATWEVQGQQVLPAILRMPCAVSTEDDYCKLGSIDLAPRVSIPLVGPGDAPSSGAPAPSEFIFVVDEVRPGNAPPSLP
jgi:hypothetical protein